MICIDSSSRKQKTYLVQCIELASRFERNPAECTVITKPRNFKWVLFRLSKNSKFKTRFTFGVKYMKKKKKQKRTQTKYASRPVNL